MTNEAQIAFWNADGGRRWTERQEWLDQLLAPFSAASLAAASPKAGERIIDVGCGCGDTTLALARAAGPTGAVLGVDVSAPMLARAKARAAEAGLANATFMEADASVASLPASDLLYSRFGVMFFADPVAAFTALRNALKPGGRLAFACWRAFMDNPWALIPAMAGIQALGVAPTPPDPTAPGPFAFADSARVRTILESARFADVALAPFDAPLRLGAALDEAARMSLEVGPLAALLRETGADPAPVIAAVSKALEPYAGPNGVALEGRIWIATARA
jgi:SAM-dependent methyltransferase